MEAYESVSCVKNEVFVYRIPARTSNRGYRAAEWKLDEPDWTGRLRVVAKGKDLTIKLEDKTSGELFALCPVDEYPGVAVEQVLDSSRYFVLRIKDPSGRSAFIGIGFGDRGDSFDLNVALQDHFKWVKREEDSANNASALFDSGPKLDLGFKEGQTIKININTKRNNAKRGEDDDDDDEMPRSRPQLPKSDGGSASGLLPPPPGSGGMKLPPPPRGNVVQPSPSQPKQSTQPATHPSGKNDLLLDLGSSSQPAAQQNDGWGDFTSASSNTSGSTQPSNWVNFG